MERRLKRVIAHLHGYKVQFLRNEIFYIKYSVKNKAREHREKNCTWKVMI